MGCRRAPKAGVRGMSKRIEPTRFRCCRCHEPASEVAGGSVTIESSSVLRLCLPKGWELKTEPLELHDATAPRVLQISFLCTRCIWIASRQGRSGEQA
jgi:hypothetical protein